MKRWRMKPRVHLIAAVICFLIAALHFSGLVLRNDRPGRFIFGAVWSVAGAVWLSRSYYLRLKAREGELRDLRADMLTRVRDTAAQQERNRLARELHDSIKQQVFSISMGAAAAQARWESDPQGARQALDDVQGSAQEAMAEMNALLQQLSPAPLEKVGLVQALRDQCQALGYRTDAEVVAQFGELPADDRLPAGAQESLFRIAQEAFSNVARHARARHVRLYLGQRDSGGPLRLEIEDDGQGFDVDQVESGMGLGNIRQRASVLGGELALESTPGSGTTLCVHIPLAALAPSRVEATQEHTLNKVFLVGLGAGLATIAVLFYPLYVLVPGRTVAGWPAGSPVVGLLFEIAALLLAGAAGWLAARWAGAGTRWRGALLGATAGCVAGAVLFVGIGAPAAAVFGGTALLERGLVPAASQADAIRLLARSVSGIVGGSHCAFWATLLAGAGLGAMGGLLASPKRASSRQADLRLPAQMILTVAAIVSALCVGIAVARFALLEPTIREGLTVNGVLLESPLPLARVSDWLIGTPLFFFVASSVAAYGLLRAAARRTEDPARLGTVQVSAALLALVSFGLPVYLWATGAPTLPRGGAVLPRGWMDLTGLPHPGPVSIWDALGAHTLIPGLVSSLALGGLHAAVFYGAHRRQQAMGTRGVQAGLRLLLSQSISAGLGVVVATVIPPMTLISTVVGIGLIANLPIEVLLGYEFAPAFTLLEIVRSVYLNQASAFLAIFAAATAVAGLMALLIGGITDLAEQSVR